MTKYWTTNSCSINQNSLQGWDAQGIRKGLYSELFFLFFIYFISQLLHSLFYKTSTQSANDLRQPISQGNQTTKKELPWHQKKWNRNFAIIFSHNCVAVGMCVLFSPFAGSMVIAYLHLLFFIIYCAMELKFLVLPARIVRILMDLCNLILILIGTISINLNTCKSDGTCKAVDSGVLSNSTCFG